jgi:hypothetical protein
VLLWQLVPGSEQQGKQLVAQVRESRGFHQQAAAFQNIYRKEVEHSYAISRKDN